MSGWIRLRDTPVGVALVGGVGDPTRAPYLAITRDMLVLTGGAVQGRARFEPGTWHFVAATSDGARTRLYLDGAPVATGPALTAGTGTLNLAPRVAGAAPFGGSLAGFTVRSGALSADVIRTIARNRPDFALTVFATGSPTWPLQLTNAPGQLTPQDAWTLPTAKAPFDRPVATPPYSGPALVADGVNRWSLPKWRLMPGLTGDGAALSRPGHDVRTWYAATVPGTVLTTLIDRGVYPDPEHGLNNMAIPESLARQDSWYRAEFTAPSPLPTHQLLTFGGVNYAAEVWLNGTRLGSVRGAFIRGQFDVTGRLRPGANAIAVRISPPPHPGIPNEESLYGAGFNGGMQALDGPTFFATEGWDWIPGIRDRNAGLWQGVTLSGSGELRLGDPQVVTRLPKGASGPALVELSVPVTNLSDHAVAADVAAGFDGTSDAGERDLAARNDRDEARPHSDRPSQALVAERLWRSGAAHRNLHRRRTRRDQRHCDDALWYTADDI